MILHSTEFSFSKINEEYESSCEKCDKHAKVYIQDVFIKSGVGHAVIMGGNAQEFVDDNPEAIPSGVEVLQKCNIVHTSKIAMGGATEREVYDLLNIELIKSSTNKVEINGEFPSQAVVKNKNGELKIRML